MTAGPDDPAGRPPDRCVDAHVHLWNLATDPQPWLDPATMAAIARDFAPEDLERMLDASGAAGAVVVQSSNSAPETLRLLAHASNRIAGVVGWVDLTADVAAQLNRLDGTERADGLDGLDGAGRAGPAGRRRLVGIRHLVHLDPDPAWLARPDVGSALDRLAGRGLGFDLVVRSEQLPLAAAVAGAHPDVRFVVDHLGGIADAGDEAAWLAGLRQVAARPNTYAKISGLAALVGTAGLATLRRVVDLALAAFGPYRLMYGSDWPLAELGAGPVAWRRTVDELIGGLSRTEREAIMFGTASACYRLGRSGGSSGSGGSGGSGA